MVKKIGYARADESIRKSLDEQIAELKAIGCVDVYSDNQPVESGRTLPGLSAAMSSLIDGDLLVTHSYQCLSIVDEEVDHICFTLGTRGIITINLAGARESGFVSAPSTKH